MRVLVSAATKHGSAQEVAETIAGALARAGHEARLRLPDEVAGVDEYDAAVLGSAVYAGRWLGSMRGLIEAHATVLATRPTWLFSVGPIGDPPRPVEAPADGARLAKLIGAREHRVFPGRLHRASLGLAERAVVGLLRAPEGDFRPMPEIEAWADGIARALQLELELMPSSSAPKGARFE